MAKAERGATKDVTMGCKKGAKAPEAFSKNWRSFSDETGNDKKSPPNGKETVYNENSIFSEEMNKWQCP